MRSGRRAVLQGIGGLALAGLLGGPIAVAQTGRKIEPMRLIFDTDMGNDIDDALTLAMLHALEHRGESRLLAVTITKDNPWAAPYIDAVNTFYGRPNIPIGMVHTGVTPEDGAYIRSVSQRKGARGKLAYPHNLTHGAKAPEAVGLLRQTLAAQPDASVTIVQVGFSTNLARLLTSPGDRFSPLTGSELAKRKVRQLVVMGGAFPTGDVEYNIDKDQDAARRLFAQWPSPIVASGFEVGLNILFPASSIERDFAWKAENPVVEGYKLYRPFPYDTPTWDLTAVLYVVRPNDGYFDLSPPGKIGVAADGRTTFTPAENGMHRYMIVNDIQRARIREALIYLASQPIR